MDKGVKSLAFTTWASLGLISSPETPSGILLKKPQKTDKNDGIAIRIPYGYFPGTIRRPGLTLLTTPASPHRRPPRRIVEFLFAPSSRFSSKRRGVPHEPALAPYRFARNTTTAGNHPLTARESRCPTLVGDARAYLECKSSTVEP